MRKGGTKNAQRVTAVHFETWAERTLYILMGPSKASCGGESQIVGFGQINFTAPASKLIPSPSSSSHFPYVRKRRKAHRSINERRAREKKMAMLPANQATHPPPFREKFMAFTYRLYQLYFWQISYTGTDNLAINSNLNIIRYNMFKTIFWIFVPRIMVGQ